MVYFSSESTRKEWERGERITIALFIIPLLVMMMSIAYLGHKYREKLDMQTVQQSYTPCRHHTTSPTISPSQSDGGMSIGS